MEKKAKIGLIYGIVGVIFVGLQPIVANSRPPVLDAYVSAAMTCLVETLIFFPLLLIELKKLNSNNQKSVDNKIHVLQGWKNNFWLLIFIGIIFGINQILFFVGYEMAGAINGSLTQKTTVFFSLFLGFLILKERITKIQIIFSVVLFLGLAIGVTQFFSLLEIDPTILIGVGILLLISFLWMIGHTLTKPMFSRNEITPIQMVFLRNFLSGLILIAIYFIFFPVDLKLFVDPGNLLFFFVMGAVYGSGLICWYKMLSYLDVSKAATIFGVTPITAAMFATFFLDEIFTFAHLIGMIIVIISIIVIVNQKKSIE
ncbi:hypothetical protein LCGC14_0851280 [marine sediment metagenome]|uniref:EamA domain-containing protein n=1 Tax=marine sediment metagenome TaxID=412755 RepID=A0A0F9RUX9_9ZZZZ